MEKDFGLFMEKLSRDQDLQTRAKKAMEALGTGRTEEELFNGVFVPLAKEQGLDITYADALACRAGMEEGTVSEEELKQLAGGDNKGVGATVCIMPGLGIGGVFGQGGGLCIGLGVGIGAAACFIKGVAD